MKNGLGWLWFFFVRFIHCIRIISVLASNIQSIFGLPSPYTYVHALTIAFLIIFNGMLFFLPFLLFTKAPQERNEGKFAVSKYYRAKLTTKKVENLRIKCTYIVQCTQKLNIWERENVLKFQSPDDFSLHMANRPNAEPSKNKWNEWNDWKGNGTKGIINGTRFYPSNAKSSFSMPWITYRFENRIHKHVPSLQNADAGTLNNSNGYAYALV